MLQTLQALAVLTLAVVPGAVGTFSYERHAGPLPGDISERTVRFLIGTALLFPLSALIAWPVWTHVLHVKTTGGAGTVFRNRLETGEGVPILWTALPVVYVVAPWLAGLLAGRIRVAILKRSAKRAKAWRTPVTLKAWDRVFLRPGPKLISVRLRDGHWVGGLFGPQSYASPLASSAKELLLEVSYEVDVEGKIVRDASGVPVEAGTASVMIQAADVDLMLVEET